MKLSDRIEKEYAIKMPAELQTFINGSYLHANNSRSTFYFRRFGGNPLRLVNYDEDNYRKQIYTGNTIQPPGTPVAKRSRVTIEIATSCFVEGFSSLSYCFNDAGEPLGIHMGIDFTQYIFKLGDSIAEVLHPVEELTHGFKKGKTRFRTYDDEMASFDLLTEKEYIFYANKTYKDESQKKVKDILSFLTERNVSHTIKESEWIVDDLKKLFSTVNKQPAEKKFYQIWLTKKQRMALCYVSPWHAAEMLKHGFLDGKYSAIPDEVFIGTY